MNPGSPDNPESLPLTGDSPPPVFNCVVYIAKSEQGYCARNGHWPELTRTAASERDALRQLVTAFKSRVAEEYATGATLPFHDEPSPQREDESIRLVPVHL